LPGATFYMPEIKKGSSAGENGITTIVDIPKGIFQVQASFIGYKTLTRTIAFPLKDPDKIIPIDLESQEGELREVIVQSTRTNQNLRSIPTRVEVLGAEELEEEGTMNPGDIKKLLGETTGINVQPTSAVSGTANFRIQGLDSRYTQLLKDGMPLYQGFSGSLSILQVSPLDLQQIEIIKGSASTLYGGGAIAGIVNLISKKPGTEPELTFLANGTSTGGADVSGYYSRKSKSIGTTVFSAINYSSAYDPSRSGFSAIPQTKRLTLNPKLFWSPSSHDLGWLGVNLGYENRKGGDMQVLRGKADSLHSYYERNESFRLSTELSFTHKLSLASALSVKNAVGYYDRKLSTTNFNFPGKQLSSFSEVNFSHSGKISQWVTGANFVTDGFRSNKLPTLNYLITTLGVFGQNTLKPASWFSLESGLRVDYNTPPPSTKLKGFFILPRINGLFKLNKEFTSRIGGGLGYKMPTLFNDKSEEEGYQNISPLQIGNTKPEQSVGANVDVNFRSPIGDAFISINQLFFVTRVNNPLIIVDNAFINAPGNITSRGAETNAKLSLDGLTVFLGYTFTDAREYYAGHASIQPLTAKNRVTFNASYEVEKAWRAAVEGYYTGQQLLSDGTTGRAYLTFGFLLEKMWKHFDVFVNAENVTDRRQSRWENIYTGSITHPRFKDVYTPLEGLTLNAGLRIRLFGAD